MPIAVRIRLQRSLMKNLAPLLLLLCTACVRHPGQAPVDLVVPSPTPTAAQSTLLPASPPTPERPESVDLQVVEISSPAEDLEGPPARLPEHYESYASYYAKRFNGRRTFTGERYDPDGMTAATRDFPLRSWLKVINPENGKEVIVWINDLTGKRKTPLVDLSRAAAKELGFFGKGKIHVHVIPLLPPLSANLTQP